MAIGKPLLVSERKGVAQPVLSAQTQQLSSNVPVQKIAMADYSIGMNNAMSSFAVTKELVNMVDAGVKAKMYIDQTKQQYARLNLMEDWQKTDNDFRTAFAKAITPEEQQAVKNDFAKSMQTRTNNYRKSGGLGLPTSDSVQAQRDLASLRAESNKLFSKMDTTIAANINNRTNIMLGSKNKALIKKATEDKNADTVSILNDLKSNYAQQVSVGGLIPEQAVWNLEVATDKIVTGRGNLFATDFAKQATATGQYPTDKEFKAQIEGVMGMPLGERRLKLLKESFTDAYYKEISERNRQVKAQETYALEVTEQGRLALKNKVNKALQDKTIAPELKTKLIKEAHTFDFAVPGFGAKIEKQIMDAEYGTSYKPFVEHFTTGEGRNVILENIKADGTSYFNLDELRSHLETMGGKYEGMNESTIREVLTHWRGVNDSTRKGLFTQGEEAMQTALMSMIKPDQSQVPEWLQDQTMKRLGVAPAMLQKMKDPMHLNWSTTMRYSPAHAKAWNVTLSDIKAEFDSKLGVFSKENISQPSDVQRSMLETYVGKLLEKNFSEAVNEELARLDNEKLKKREKLEAEERNRKAQVEKELPTFAMEKIGDGVSPDEPIPQEVPPNVKLIEHQMSKKRIRNAQSASTFKDQLAKGEYGSAVGTAVASKWTDITQGLRDAHEQSKLSYSESTMNERSQHIKDMAVMSKNVKETFSGGIWDKLANAVGQGEPITIEGFANDMGLLTSAIGDLLIDGVENHNIEKTPIIDTKRTRIKTPDPLATPPATQPENIPTKVGDVVQNIVGTISDLVAPTTAEAVTSISRDSSQGLYDKSMGDFTLQPGKYGPDNWNPGQRYLDANNEFTDVMPLDVRQRIIDNPDAHPQFTQYELVEGDMLGRIAKQAGITLKDLQNMNSNTIGRENKLQVGEKILLPAGSTITPSVAEPVPDKSGMYPPPKATQVEPAPAITTTQYRSSITQGGKGKAVEVNPNWSPLEKKLAVEEGLVYTPYRDGTAKDGTPLYSVGFGHQLTKAELKKYRNKKVKYSQIETWFKEDVKKAYDMAVKLANKIGRTAEGNSEFIESLADVIFQGGPQFLKAKFPTAYQALLDGDWDKAASNIQYRKPEKSKDVESGWVRQSRDRALRFRDAILRLNSADTSPVSNVAMAENTFYLSPEERAYYQKKTEEIQELLRKQRQGRTAKEQRKLENDIEKHRKELEKFKANLGGVKQELRTGEIQDKDYENYKLNMNPIYTGSDPDRDKRNI